MTSKASKEVKGPSFESAVISFIENIESITFCLPLMMTLVIGVEEKLTEKMKEFLSKNAKISKREKDRILYDVKVNKYTELLFLERSEKMMRNARKIVPKSQVVAMISQFDIFLASLIKVIFYVRPQLLDASQKQISFSDLLLLGSVEEAREFIIEKEIETVLRSSHSEQFAWLERILGMTLRKDLDVWPYFIELTERRNLFVHTDGAISNQYISICNANGVKMPKEHKVGYVLGVSNSYYKNASSSIFEIGVKLGHVIWRKLQPDMLEQADENLNQICYDLLKHGQYELASALLKFASKELKKHSSDGAKRVFVINHAAALKFSNKKSDSEKELASMDWSACSNRFNIALAVLRDDFKEAAKIMEKMGKKNSEIDQHEYVDFPIFKNFRKSKEFLTAYKKIYKKDFEILTSKTSK